MGQARIVWRGGRGAGGHLGKWTGSAWRRADNRWGSRRASRAWGDDLKGGEQAAGRGGGRRAGGLGYFSLVFRRVHLPFFRGREVCRRGGGRGGVLGPSGAGRAGGFGGRVVVPAVGAVGGGGGAAVGYGADVALLGAGGVGASVFRSPVVESADRADRVVVLAYWGSVTVSLTVAAAGGFVGGVGDLDLPLTGEKKNVGSHLLSLLRGGGNYNRGGVLEGTSVGIWVEEPSGGNRKTFSVEYSGLEVNKQPFRVAG